MSSTVYINRCQIENDTKQYFIFTYNHGGIYAYNRISNANYRLVPKNNQQSYLKFATENIKFSEIRICSSPESLQYISKKYAPEVIYEFHAPESSVIQKELEEIDFSLVDQVWTPSDTQTEVVKSLVPSSFKDLIITKSNKLNTSLLKDNGSKYLNILLENRIPLLWVGRYDKRKNFIDMLRILSLLPENYSCLFITSYTTDSDSLAQFIYNASSLNLLERIKILYNLQNIMIINLLHTFMKHGGAYCSTALDESFGYSILEAAASGIQTFSYNVSAPLEFNYPNLHFVDICDIYSYAKLIMLKTGSDHKLQAACV